MKREVEHKSVLTKQSNLRRPQLARHNSQLGLVGPCTGKASLSDACPTSFVIQQHKNLLHMVMPYLQQATSINAQLFHEGAVSGTGNAEVCV